MKTIYSAGVVTYRKHEGAIEYLLLLYPGGYWEFPKGKLEADETNEMAALRELKEETNLTVTLGKGFEEKISYTFRDRQGATVFKQVLFFVGQAHEGSVILSSEHRDYKWLTYEQAFAYIEHRNAQELLKKAHTFVAQV